MSKKLKLKVDHNRRKHKLFESSLYKLKTKRKLADLLQVTIPELKLATADVGNYVVFEQEGKSGKARTIQHPKGSQKNIHCRIASLLCRIELPEYLHSGRKKHSHITNAKAHTGNKKVLTTDIKSFFPSTTRKMVFNFFYNIMQCSSDVADLLASICTYNGHIPTGSQLSMPLAFWANIRMFEQLNNLANKHDVKMTVYVDDLTFSGDSINRHFLSVIKKIIVSNGHISHPDKTKLFEKSDVKVITGVAIKCDDVAITNKQHKLIYESLEQWKGCRDEPLISSFVIPKLLGRLHAHSNIEPKLKDKINSILNYKPVKNPSSASTE
ncbi:reverse transcriptase family protein [Pseudoalteromonas sp.]|uniref:reverse transcriptase family protein n=1 Tax=Pseudoalteromonas sp. TaxID=53249 RepID=UPI0035C6F242